MERLYFILHPFPKVSLTEKNMTITKRNILSVGTSASFFLLTYFRFFSTKRKKLCHGAVSFRLSPGGTLYNVT